jgi:signal recognition particle receptor subunit beta
LSDIDVVNTDVSASDETRALKPTTTVAMDYGLLRLNNGDQVRLYGAPGQKRFDFMWEILTENALGLVLLINARAADPAQDLRDFVQAFRKLIDRSALVVGLTHSEDGFLHVRHSLSHELVKLGLKPCVMDTDARKRKDVSMLVKSLIYIIEPEQDGGA